MSLLTAGDQHKLRDAFAEMTRSVRLLFFTQTFDCETCPTARQILDELPPLSEKISIEEVNLVLDTDKAKAYGVYIQRLGYPKGQEYMEAHRNGQRTQEKALETGRPESAPPLVPEQPAPTEAETSST